MFEKLGGKIEDTAGKDSGPKAEVGPFKTIKSWTNAIKEKTFGVLEAWKYAPDCVTIDLKGGGIFWAVAAVNTSANFAFEIEARFMTEYERGALVGFVFGGKQYSNFISAFIQKSEVCLVEHEGEAKNELSPPYLMPPVEIGTWHRLGAVIRGNRIEVWFDGKKVHEHTAAARSDFIGQIGIWQQRCKAEYRLIRIGKAD